MSDGEFLVANFSRGPGVIGAHFELPLEAGAEEVWSFLTAPDRLPQWLAPGSIELREGGAAKLDFQDSGIVIDSQVTRCEAPHALAYSWSAPGQPDRPVRWTLAADGEGTHLSLDLELPSDEDAARSAAGWAAHLEMLAAAMAGAPMKFPFPTFKAAREAFNDKVAQLPA
ncbi:SRPBCC domain-containing protein [Phenylobacterium koreense]|uniref:Uncharacterized protein YndB with AHSA1/START domain n=1 Tax=Phenylobacterium koreense TaxID=266125 RepID=A0ABV2EPB0_9CAUL